MNEKKQKESYAEQIERLFYRYDESKGEDKDCKEVKEIGGDKNEK